MGLWRVRSGLDLDAECTGRISWYVELLMGFLFLPFLVVTLKLHARQLSTTELYPRL